MIIEIGTNEAGQRIDKFSRKLFKDVPLSAIYKAIRKGDIRINGKKIKEKYFLIEGDVYEANYIKSQPKKKDFNMISNTSMKVTYEDTNMLVVEKWPGVLVHADRKNGEATLTDHVLSYLHEKGEYNPETEITFTPASCNRLDKNTSGLVVFGKNFSSMKLLNQMIREKDVEKYYMALIKGKIKDGLYEGYISKDERGNKATVYKTKQENTKRIAMKVKTMETIGSFSYIEINLLTGRSHQIRAHLSYLGNPIVGDPKYGNKEINNFFANKFGLSFQFLYAYKLIFKNCPPELDYLENKTVIESMPPIFKKVKKDVMRFD